MTKAKQTLLLLGDLYVYKSEIYQCVDCRKSPENKFPECSTLSSNPFIFSKLINQRKVHIGCMFMSATISACKDGKRASMKNNKVYIESGSYLEAQEEIFSSTKKKKRKNGIILKKSTQNTSGSVFW